MRRLLSIAALVVFGLSLTNARTVEAAGDSECPGCVDDKDGTQGDPAGDPQVPAEKEAYCDDPAFPEFHRTLMPKYRTADDVTIGSLNRGFDPQDATPVALVIPKIAVAREVYQWCHGPTGDSKKQYFWVPLATPDSVALKAGLLAKVQGRLSMPEVVWLDIDKDHGWLWVNIDHHVSITPPAPVNESARDGNLVTGFATAWVKAAPVSLTIELPRETGVKGTQLARCDLTQATSGKGCEIKFTHSSSITNDGWFVGRAKITWAVTSNSGKYNGVGPFTTSSEVRVQVAEMMAVSRPVED